MAIQMSNFDNFDIDKMSSKLAQRYFTAQNKSNTLPICNNY